MRKFLKYFSLILFFIPSKSDALIIFSRTYGFGPSNEAQCIIQTSDNGYAVVGSTTPGWGGQTNFYLIKIDSLGDLQFQYSYGGNEIDRATSVIQMADSGYLIAGYSNSFSIPADYNAYLLRTDKAGAEIWSKTIGTSDWDFINDMKRTPDGNFILAGNSYGSGSGSSSGYMVKVDSLGNIIWEKFIDQDRQVNFKKLYQISDGRLILCGSLSSSVTTPEDGFIVFADENGDTIRTVTVDNGKIEILNSLSMLSNGDVIYAGTSTDTAISDDGEWLLKTDTLGNILLSAIQFGASDDEFTDIAVRNDTIIAVGSSISHGAGKYDYHVSLFDGNGNYFFGGSSGGSEDERSSSIALSNSGGFIVAGSSTTYLPGHPSVYLVKFNDQDSVLLSDTHVTIDVNEIRTERFISIFPNPASEQLIINSSSVMGKINIKITDLNGREILFRPDEMLPIKIEIPEIHSGVYFIEVSNQNFSERKKIVIIN